MEVQRIPNVLLFSFLLFALFFFSFLFLVSPSPSSPSPYDSLCARSCEGVFLSFPFSFSLSLFLFLLSPIDVSLSFSPPPFVHSSSFLGDREKEREKNEYTCLCAPFRSVPMFMRRGKHFAGRGKSGLSPSVSVSVSPLLSLLSLLSCCLFYSFPLYCLPLFLFLFLCLCQRCMLTPSLGTAPSTRSCGSRRNKPCLVYGVRHVAE